MFDDFTDIYNPLSNFSCAITLKYKSNFEFISTNKISVVGTNPILGQPYTRMISDFARCERNVVSHVNPQLTFTSFERNYRNRNLAIFKTTLNNLVHKVALHLLDINIDMTTQVADLISKIDAQTINPETYVIIAHSNEFSDVKNYERLIVNSFIIQEEEKDESVE